MNIIKLLLSIILLSSTIGAEKSPVIVHSLEDAIALSESSKKDILLVFSADWCKNCIRLKDQFLYTNDQSLENIIICIVDFDKQSDIIKEYKVKKIPDSRVIRNNIEISQIVGFTNKDNYKQWLQNARH